MFSFTLFERGEHSNLLRVQTDNFDQPFDLNEGARLDLGSTAKLRTLVTYLELVAELHRRWSGLSAEQIAALKISSRDPLARWARDYLAQAGDKSLTAMLDAAMERRYLRQPRRRLLHRRRPAPFRELRARGQPPHDERARGAHALGESGLHPTDARRGAARDGARRGRECGADR